MKPNAAVKEMIKKIIWQRQNSYYSVAQRTDKEISAQIEKELNITYGANAVATLRRKKLNIKNKSYALGHKNHRLSKKSKKSKVHVRLLSTPAPAPVFSNLKIPAPLALPTQLLLSAIVEQQKVLNEQLKLNGEQHQLTNDYLKQLVGRVVHKNRIENLV